MTSICGETVQKVTLRLNRLKVVSHAVIDEISKGHVINILEELYYVVDMRFVHKVDISYVSVDELGLPTEVANSYTGSGGPNLERVLDKLKIRPEDSIIDLGCGKGSALITFAKYPFKKIAGIDLSSALIKVAENNFANMSLSKIKLFCGDAGAFSDFDEYNYIYMYNPFPCQVVENVMANVSKSLNRVPRNMYILYNYPKCHEIIMQTALFKHVDAFDNLKSHKFCIYVHEDL